MGEAKFYIKIVKDIDIEFTATFKLTGTAWAKDDKPNENDDKNS